MSHALVGDMTHCFCDRKTNARKCCICGLVKERDWETLHRRKAFAVAIFVKIWDGGELPPPMIVEAEIIRAQMKQDGTWASA